MASLRWLAPAIALLVGASCTEEEGSVWQSGTDGNEGADAAAEGDGDGASADAGDTGAEGEDGGADETGDAGEEDDPLFDVGDGGDIDLECGCDLAYIWIANSQEGTVSKINTQTMQEEGRYLTRADGNGNPSRTSVSLSGDVAVANRHGGLVKFYAEKDDCVESNGIDGIQTSTGPDDVLDWAVEECRAWYTEFPTTNQRPVAWTQGSSIGDCDSTGEMVWTVMSALPGIAPGTGGPGGVVVALVDGADGSIAEQITVDGFSGMNLGAYGGAVDGEGNLYFSPMGGLELGAAQLARVDAGTLEVTLWPLPIASYGITVDHNGRVWVSGVLGAGAGRFDPDTEAWDMVPGAFSSQGGLAVGPDDHMWIATDSGAVSVHVDTLALGPTFTPPSGGLVKGVSVDGDGFVWAVNGVAWKFDPATGAEVGSYDGLDGPYTYSDMTGYALQNATCPPEG